MDTNYKNKLVQFYSREKRMPTYTEMMRLFGFKSKNAVFKLVEKMIDAGLVAKDHLGRLVPMKSFDEIPMLGLVKAGIPSDVEEMVLDTVKLDDLLVGKKEFSYILEVDGDSMIEAHISEGDMILVEKINHARDGDIVVAEVDGEYTLKYFRIKGEKKWLEPANKNYKPIYPKYSFNIIAKLKAVIRKY
ncbi:MAG: transcriptional repressor LexA [Candidatus Paceibacteria bacterium]